MRRVTALLSIMGLLVLPACQRGGDDAPKRGGRLRVGVTSLGSLDPAQARTVEQLLVADQLFDSLTTWEGTDLEAVGSIAERWEASPDQKQWDFFLSPEARFADGREIVAADVKYSLERVARRGSGSAGADLLELVSGFGPFAKDGSADELVGVTAPEPGRVHISLDQPLAVLPLVLGAPVLGIVPRQSVEATTPPFAEAPLGSGPFKVARRTPDLLSIDAVSGDTRIDGVEFVHFHDVATSYEAFERGELDWSRVPPDRVEDAKVKYGDRGFTPYAAELLYGFNLKSPKLQDSRIREAILLALDRKAIVRAVYGSTVLPLDGIVVEGVPGHQTDPCAGRCRHDPDRARQLLGEARFGQGPLEIAIDFDDDVTQQALARAMASNLEQVGVKATLRPKPLGEYQSFALSGQQELFRLGWIASYPSPDAFLPPLFTTGSPSNLTGHSVPGVDGQLREARAEADPVKRLSAYRAVERSVMFSLPVIPLAQLEVHAVMAKSVRGLTQTSMGTFDASSVWLAT